ncbi:hypothetical protein ACGFR6_27555 [Streptomyces sp. NPDC048567]|uniref:hypothetical protein n=1 Tax=Streptomyces sp. NPDC048567 TaxID=3365570 RepID=UPI003714608B
MTHAPRVYGSDGEADTGPDPGHDYRELVGGPLDGQLLDTTGWTADMLAGGAYLITPLSAYGAGGRASYAPAPDDPEGPFVWEGDVA